MGRITYGESVLAESVAQAILVQWFLVIELIRMLYVPTEGRHVGQCRDFVCTVHCTYVQSNMASGEVVAKKRRYNLWWIVDENDVYG